MGNIYLDIAAIGISLIALVVSIVIWLSDKKSIWYWNIVIVPIQETFKEFKKVDISDKTAFINNVNSYTRNLKDYVSFLEISIKEKKVQKIQDFIEAKMDRVANVVMTEPLGGNYLEVISSFEVRLYKKIAKLILKRVKKED